MRITISTADVNRLIGNVRDWSKFYPNEVVYAGAKKVAQYARNNIQPHNKTGDLFNSIMVSRSPKQRSASVIADARHRGKPYAIAVEKGAMNPWTGRMNRPVKFIERALLRYAGEHGSLVEKKLRETFPKK